MKAVDYFFIMSVVFFTAVVTASICSSAEADTLTHQEVFKLSDDTINDMFSDPVRYRPVFREIMKSQELYQEVCLELATSIIDMSEEQYYRYNDCREYFRKILGISLDDAIDIRNNVNQQDQGTTSP
ncbi:MAG: hypothetical protein VW270_04210 [Candidatus Poseidoniales archaeon]